MLAKIKNIPVGTELDNMQFLERMQLNGAHFFARVETATPEVWDGWWMLAEYTNVAHGCVYHISWLEVIDDTIE